MPDGCQWNLVLQREQWRDRRGTRKTDGSQTGTKLVKDIRVGGYGSSPAYLSAFSGQLFFQANNGLTGSELWTSDGTTAGTASQGHSPGYYGSYPRYLTDVNGKLFFVANDGTQGSELWVTDGTAAGTAIVKDIRSVVGVLSAQPGERQRNSVLSAFDSTNGYELWKSDGTSGGTVLVKDIRTGAYRSYPSYLTNVNGTLFFRANDGTNGYELWKSNGTAATTRVGQRRPLGLRQFVSEPTDERQWDPVLPGRRRHQRLRAVEERRHRGWHGPGEGHPFRLRQFYPAYLTNLNGTLLFRANDGTTGYELWKATARPAAPRW